MNQSVISLEHVNYTRNHHCILRDINWRIDAGEHWALVGLNGSGKSTLVNILSGYDWPSEGTVRVLGQTFGQTNIPRLRQRIGLVSSWITQRLPVRETAENIVITGAFSSFGIYQPVSEKQREEARKLLAQFGMKDFAERKMETLSQGETQRVLILRALMTDPELIILDEPTNALDLFSREELLDFLVQLSHEKTSLSQLMITHRTEEITPLFDHLCLLKDGQIFKQGLRTDYLNQETFEAFYDRSIQAYRFGEDRLLITP